jgi:hypothetical protein
MVDSYKPPFGTYTSVAVASAAAQTEIVDGIQSLATLFGITIADAGTYTIGKNADLPKPDFDRIDPATRIKLAEELSALAKAVEAMPTA